MTKLHGSQRWGVVAAVIAVPLVMSACDYKTELLLPQNPAVITSDLVQSSTAADALRKGVINRLKSLQSADGPWDDAGLVADEWKSANTFFQHQELDSRSMTLNDAEVAGVYSTLQAARGAAYTGVAALNTYPPTGSAWPPYYFGQMWFVMGFMEFSLAENFCNGIPLSQTVAGAAVYGQPLTDSAVFNVAISHLDSAMSFVAAPVATDTASLTLQYAIRITKARALVNQGQFAAAAALTAPVPTDWQWTFNFVTSSGDNGLWNYNNSVKRFTVGDSFDIGGIIANALPFASAKDPRVPVKGSTTAPSTLGNGFDTTTPLVDQQIWPNRSDPIPFLAGWDARLIEAEARLQANDIPGMMAILNALRASPHVLGAISSPAMAPLPNPANQVAATSLYFREKAFWQFGRGYRLPDLRRLVRQYGRTQDNVFPNGQFFKGGIYGPDVNFPVPTSENTNPNFLACIDRNA